MPVDHVLTPKKCPFISEGVDTILTKSKRRRKKILTDKVKEYIKKLGASKLTKAQIAIIKDHHEFHGDKKVKIVGSLPGHGVFVRCFNHQGCKDSVVEHLYFDDDCSEDEFVRDADEEEELRLIKRWMIRHLSSEERRELIRKGCW